jgi:hypothetical protein
LTDIAKFKTADPNAVIGNWMRNRNTIEYLGIWECLYNPNFKKRSRIKYPRLRHHQRANLSLSNMENLNAVFINEGLPQRECLIKSNKIAIQQMSILQEVENRKLFR